MPGPKPVVKVDGGNEHSVTVTDGQSWFQKIEACERY